MLACGGVSHHDDERSGAVDGEEPSAAALVCGGNDLTWGTLPDVARFAVDVTLDGEPLRCEGDGGGSAPLVLVLKGAQYVGPHLTFTCNDATLHVTVGSELAPDDSCPSYGELRSTATDSEYQSYGGTGTLTSTIVLDGATRVILVTGETRESGVGTGSLHFELLDEYNPSLPPRILDGHFTVQAAAVALVPPTP